MVSAVLFFWQIFPGFQAHHGIGQYLNQLILLAIALVNSTKYFTALGWHLHRDALQFWHTINFSRQVAIGMLRKSLISDQCLKPNTDTPLTTTASHIICWNH